MSEKFYKFKVPVHNRNPHCKFADQCKGLCGCVLVLKQQLTENKLCPIHKKCKKSAGCFQTIADINCPVCQGYRTDYELSDGSWRKCVCNTCNTRSWSPLSIGDTVKCFMMDTPDGYGRTIQDYSDDFPIYRNKLAKLREIMASK